IFRILNSLEECGWVYAENLPDKKYGLTLKPFEITSKARNRLTLNNVATPLVYELWKKTGESTYLGIKNDDKVMYIQHFDSTKNVRVAGAVGGLYDLYCTAPGKIILSYSDDAYIEEYTDRELKKNTQNTITQKSLLLKEIQNIKSDGYAVDNEEFGNGIICLAAPIFDCSNNAVATVGCSVSTVCFTCDEAISFLKPLITETAAEISARLGYSNK
ncbi:MAG: IclR family transcriptional regulator, partial [Clostridia bacterium]|nr:IclR family transcriptional regulator [Clostridia bacterium]